MSKYIDLFLALCFQPASFGDYQGVRPTRYPRSKAKTLECSKVPVAYEVQQPFTRQDLYSYPITGLFPKYDGPPKIGSQRPSQHHPKYLRIPMIKIRAQRIRRLCVANSIDPFLITCFMSTSATGPKSELFRSCKRMRRVKGSMTCQDKHPQRSWSVDFFFHSSSTQHTSCPSIRSPATPPKSSIVVPLKLMLLSRTGT